MAYRAIYANICFSGCGGSEVMKPLFTQEEYDSVRYQDRLPCECYQCTETFYAKKHDISRFIKRGDNTAMFCGKTCMSRYRTLNSSKQCPTCLQYFNLIVINKHIESCGVTRIYREGKYYRIDKRKKYSGETKIICSICNKEFNQHGIGTHHYMKHEGNAQRMVSEFKNTRVVPENVFLKAKEEGTTFVVTEEVREKLRKSSTGRKHTEESKNKIRIHQIKYYQENPDKIPFKLYNYEEKSRPEKLFEHTLTSSTITQAFNYVYEHKFNIYYFDFAWLDIKLDVEIDGDFHLKPARIIRDEMRDEFSIKNGWTVIRFEARLVNKNPEYCVSKLKHVFDNLEMYKNKRTKFWYKDYVNKKAPSN